MYIASDMEAQAFNNNIQEAETGGSLSVCGQQLPGPPELHKNPVRKGNQQLRVKYIVSH